MTVSSERVRRRIECLGHVLDERLLSDAVEAAKDVLAYAPYDPHSPFPPRVIIQLLLDGHVVAKEYRVAMGITVAVEWVRESIATRDKPASRFVVRTLQ